MITWDNKYKWGMYIVNITEDCTVEGFSNNDITIRIPEHGKQTITDLVNYKYNQVKHLFENGQFEKFIVKMKGNELTLSLLNILHPIHVINPKITATCEVNGNNIHCRLWLI